jgi:hypothetical protein
MEGVRLRGRWIKLSIPRRIVIDFMYFAAGLPSIAAQRRLTLRGVVEAREAHPDRPTWTAVFAKAFALVAVEIPELRRVYVRLPWPHFHESGVSTASVVVERSYDGEPGLALVQMTGPETLSIGEIAARIKHGKLPDFARSRRFRRMVALARLPLLLRRAVWWIVLNNGGLRAKYFGTFGVSTVSSTATEILQPRSPLTTLVTYDAIAADGGVSVRLVFDHRVFDAMTAARALDRLEAILNGPVADELRVGGRTPHDLTVVAANRSA